QGTGRLLDPAAEPGAPLQARGILRRFRGASPGGPRGLRLGEMETTARAPEPRARPDGSGRARGDPPARARHAPGLVAPLADAPAHRPVIRGAAVVPPPLHPGLVDGALHPGGQRARAPPADDRAPPTARRPRGAAHRPARTGAR